MTPGPPEGASARNSNLVAGGILLSRMAGLARERAIGHFLGSGLAVEAFRAALRIPNLLQNLLGEGVLSASFIPVYARLRAEGKPEEAGRVAGAVAGLLLAVSGALVVLGVVFARPLTAVLAGGFAGEKLELTVRLVRILTPGVGFLVLSAWCLGVLNSHRRFFLPYVAPVLWNAAMIAALVTFGLRGLADTSLATALAWGTFAGGALQLGVQLPAVLRLIPGVRPSLRTDLPGVRRVVAAFGPVVGGRGVVQLLGYVELVLASFLATGALASLSYAQVLYLLPISLFGMSVAAAELPELSSATPSDAAALGGRLSAGLSRIAFFVVPTVVVYLCLGDLVVGALFQTGEFDEDTTVQVWAVLAAFTPGLLATTSSRLLQSVLYGAGDARRPAVIAAVRVTVAVAVGSVLMLQFDQMVLTTEGFVLTGDLPSFSTASAALRASPDNLHRLGAVGLALGASVGALLEYLLLRRAVRRYGAKVRQGGGRLARIAAAAAVAGGAGLLLRPLVDGLHPIVGGALALTAAGAAYLGMAGVLHLPEVAPLGALARRRR